MIGKYHNHALQTNLWHCEEWHCEEEPQNINKHKKAGRKNHRLRKHISLRHQGMGGGNAFCWNQIFLLDFVVVKIQTKCLTHMEASLLMQCIITEKQSNHINTL